MHNIEISAPKGKGKDVAELALNMGIQQVSARTVYSHGEEKEQDEVTVQTDTPSARAFLDKLMTARFFDPKNYNILSEDIPALVYSQDLAKLTEPFGLPTTNVFEEMWVRNHLNPTYIARCIVSSLILSYGMIENDVITMIAALLFTPFLTKVQGASFGVLTQQWNLAARGGLLLLLSTVITLICGAIVAVVVGGPLQYNSFAPIWVNFLISLLVGVVAGIATADVSGKRDLIAMTAAAQFAVFPAWFGIMLVLGLPEGDVATQRLMAFLVNVATIFGVSTLVYYLLGYKKDALERFTSRVPPDKKKKSSKS